MSDGRTATAAAATRVGSGAGRLVRAWRTMPHERRLAAYAAIGLFLSLFLPWYQRQFFVVLGGKIQPASDSQTAWGAFSFIEAAILLVAVGVLLLLFQRAEGKAFHLPGGDGGVITGAGVWSAILIIWRIFDKQGGAAQGQNATTYGIEWGIFVALAIAIGLTYAGSRIRAAHRPEPPLPGEDDPAPAPRGPIAPPPHDMPVIEARVHSAAPTPVPADPPWPRPSRASHACRSGPRRVRARRARRVHPSSLDRAALPTSPHRRAAARLADGPAEPPRRARSAAPAPDLLRHDTAPTLPVRRMTRRRRSRHDGASSRRATIS